MTTTNNTLGLMPVSAGPDLTDIGVNETFLGNTPDGVPQYLSSFTTIRIGEKPRDIHGQPLDVDEYQPMYIGNNEMPKYNRLMTERFSRIRRDLPVEPRHATN